MKRAAKILFVLHNATRTGAPLVMLDFLRWASIHKPFAFHILLLTGGELEPEFRGLAKTWTIHAQPHSFFARQWTRMMQPIREWLIFMRLRFMRYSKVYGNTVSSALLLAKYKRLLNVPYILHLHEGIYAIESIIGTKAFQSALPAFESLIAVSPLVRNHLITHYHVEEQRIHIAPPCPQLPSLDSIENRRNDLGIKEDTFVIGGAGVVDWIKGTDLFVQLAEAFARKCASIDFLFLWIGKVPQIEKIRMEHELSQRGLSTRVRFVGPTSQPLDYFSAFDIFALTSREESFSLATLENAYLGTPTICFRGCAGIEPMLQDGAGILVEFGDIEGMADQILALAIAPDIRMQMGRQARQKALAHLNSANTSHKIIEAILCSR